MLHHGLYEQVINSQLSSELSEIPETRKAVAPIDKAEASKVLAQYLADVVQKGLDNVADNGGDISAQIALTNQIVDLIQNTTREADFAALGVDQRAEQLLALLEFKGLLADWKQGELKEPETHDALERKLRSLISQGILTGTEGNDFDYVKDQRWKCDYSLYRFGKAEAQNCLQKTEAFCATVERLTT